MLKIEEIPDQYIHQLGLSHGQRIATLVGDAIITTLDRIAGEKSAVQVCLSPMVDAALAGLRSFMFERIYCGPFCQAESEKAEYIIDYLFNYFCRKPHKLPEFYRQIEKEESLERAVADFIAGMSDNYCVNMFNEVAVPRSFF